MSAFGGGGPGGGVDFRNWDAQRSGSNGIQTEGQVVNGTDFFADVTIVVEVDRQQVDQYSVTVAPGERADTSTSVTLNNPTGDVEVCEEIDNIDLRESRSGSGP